MTTVLTADTADTAAPGPGQVDESPVFILTASRSGSTLLRFILDSHPDLACPPETSIASVCAGLARTWDILESAGSGAGRLVHEPLPLPPHAAVAVREAIDAVYGHYLRRRGKLRWCDKSLDSFQFADLITQVYPQAKFVCLYRHGMDVVASGVEACPWGLHRFGFDPHVAQYPGNSVAAIGSYWLTVTRTVLAFEAQRPDACLRVRYEDLVTAPEQTVAGILTFLGLTQVPGLARACFQTPHEGEGPGDEKIWFTTGVATGSIGRGVTVPAAALPPEMREAFNETLATLGYRPVDAEWNSAHGRLDPRATGTAGGNGTAGHGRDGGLARVVAAIGGRLREAGEDRMGVVCERWPAVAGAVVAIVVESPDGESEEMRLRFRPGPLASPAAPGDGGTAPGGTAPGGTAPGGTAPGGTAPGGTAPGGTAPGYDGADPVAQVMASAATWESLLDGRANLVTEMTSGRLRCVNKRDDHRIRSDELHALATVLGIASIPMAHTPAVPLAQPAAMA